MLFPVEKQLHPWQSFDPKKFYKSDGKGGFVEYNPTPMELMLIEQLLLEQHTGRAWFRAYKKQRLMLWASCAASVLMLAAFWL